MDDREKVLWLARRAGFGLRPGELDGLVARGPAAFMDLLIDPDADGVAPAPDPFASITDPADPQDAASRAQAVRTFTFNWLDHMVSTPRGLEEMMTWFWHDHFAVQSSVVKSGRLMADHVNVLRKYALGNFRTMIRLITTDAAMLIYLDGAKSTRVAPNENYGREMLELFTMGIGNYTEADVRSAAVALTGWQVNLRTGQVAFNARLHDTRPQSFLGGQVSDVDTVVNAAVSHPATARFIAGKVAAFFLGPDVDPSLVERFAAAFSAANLELKPLVRAVLQAGLDGHGTPIVRSPVVWWVMARRATGANPDARAVASYLDAAGQLPGNPPNVGGWPGMQAWLGASPTAMRATLASVAADQTARDASVMVAASNRDLDRLAGLLNIAGGFADSTKAAIDHSASCGGARPGVGVLTIALASPDALVA